MSHKNGPQILIMIVFIMCIMCLIIFEEKVEVQDQYHLSLNLVQKANNPIQDRDRNIGPLIVNASIQYVKIFARTVSHIYWFVKIAPEYDLM